jgi:hypothetical protein
MQTKNNRKKERISIQARATIENNSHAGDGLLMDFTRQGLGLFLDHNESIDIGKRLDINLKTAPKPTTVQGVIKWVRKLKEGKSFDCAVGMELIDFDTVGYGNLLRHADS